MSTGLRTSAGATFDTARKLVETGLTEYLQKVVPSSPDYLVPLFEQETPNGYGLGMNGEGNLWPVEFENEPQSPALVDHKSKQRPWFRVIVADNFSTQKALGRFGYSRSYVLASIDIYVRAGDGTSRARLIADELNDWYRDLNPEAGSAYGVDLGLTPEEWQGVIIRQPEMTRDGPEDPEKWFRMRLMMELEMSRYYAPA